MKKHIAIHIIGPLIASMLVSFSLEIIPHNTRVIGEVVSLIFIFWMGCGILLLLVKQRTRIIPIAKQVALKLNQKIERSFTDEEFEFYKTQEINPARYNHLLSQKNNCKLELKAKFNWIAFLFPVLWLARIKFIRPLFLSYFIFIIVAFIIATINYAYSRVPLETIMIAGLILVIFMNVIRVPIAIWGHSIENLLILRRLRPLLSFYKETGKHPDEELKNILTRASWYRVVFMWTLYSAASLGMFAFIIEHG